MCSLKSNQAHSQPVSHLGKNLFCYKFSSYTTTKQQPFSSHIWQNVTGWKHKLASGSTYYVNMNCRVSEEVLTAQSMSLCCCLWHCWSCCGCVSLTTVLRGVCRKEKHNHHGQHLYPFKLDEQRILQYLWLWFFSQLYGEYFFPSNNNFAKREDPISPLCLVKSISISILKLSAHFIQQTLTKQVYIIIIW